METSLKLFEETTSQELSESGKESLNSINKNLNNKKKNHFCLCEKNIEIEDKSGEESEIMNKFVIYILNLEIR